MSQDFSYSLSPDAEGGYQLSTALEGAYVEYLEIDYFEDGDIAEWTEVAQTGTVDFETGNTHEGDFAVRAGADGPVDLYTDASHSPSPPYLPQPGDYWSFAVKFNVLGAGASFRFWYGTQDSAGGQNQYEIELYQDGTFRLEKDTNGTNSEIDPTNGADYSLTYQTGTWYEVHVWWQHPDKANDHVLELRDPSGTTLSTIFADDLAFGAGGIRIETNDVTGASVDTLRIFERTA